MEITLVKKILATGEPCRKCAEVEAWLGQRGLMERIDRIVVADARNPASDGMQLARRHAIERAPFFVVTYPDGRSEAHDIVIKFVREILEPAARAA